MRLSLLPLPFCAALALFGCGADTPPPALEIRLAPKLGSCQSGGEAEELSSIGASTLRLTVIQTRSTGSEPQLLCDRVVELDESGRAGSTDLAMDADEKGRLDLLVELFTAGEAKTLIAGGLLRGLNDRPRLGPLKVLLSRAGEFACTPSLDRPRAFHSATTLPDGRVLLVGGLTHNRSAGAADELWLEPSATLYDPRSGLFTELVSEGLGRAFHHARLLSSQPEGPYDVLLIGGFQLKEGQVAAAARFGVADATLPLIPTAATEPAPAQIVRIYPYTDPPRLVMRPAAPSLEGRMFSAMAQLDDGNALVLGGFSDYADGRLATVDTAEQLPAGSSEHRGPYSLSRTRVAAAAAALSERSFLILGGNFDSPPGRANAETVEIASIESDGVSTALATYEVGSQQRLSALAHADLQSLGNQEVLLSGGLVLEPGRARTLRTDFPVQRLTAVATDLRVSNVASAVFVPVVYHATQRFGSGQVLLTGGLAAASTCPSGRACHKAYVYRAQGDTLDEVGTLRAGRFGHRLSPVGASGMLVTGGLTMEGQSATIQALAGAELINVDQGSNDAFGRAPGVGSPSNTCSR